MPIRTWSQQPVHYLWTSTAGRPVELYVACDSMFWWGPYYTTRYKSLWSMSVQTSGDIVCLAIVLSVVSSLESAHFRKRALLDEARLICATQPGFQLLAQHMHFIKAKSWTLYCISWSYWLCPHWHWLLKSKPWWSWLKVLAQVSKGVRETLHVPQKSKLFTY